jgi:histidine triad (HIT) family protein
MGKHPPPEKIIVYLSTQSSELLNEERLMDCLFCKIAAGQIPAKIVYKDDVIVAFEDINPQAPHHIIIIPHKHIATLNDLNTEDNQMLGHMVQSAAKLAKQLNIAEDGYRLVINCNAGAGQSVFHIHFHLLGGRRLTWPPG